MKRPPRRRRLSAEGLESRFLMAADPFSGDYAVPHDVVGDEDMTQVPAAEDVQLSIQRPGRNELGALLSDRGYEFLKFDTLRILRGPEKGSLEIDRDTGTMAYNASGCASGDDDFRFGTLNDRGYPIQAEVHLSSNAWDQVCGDANRDGLTNTLDLEIVREHLFSTNADWNSGDFSGDGVVDVSDVNLWNDFKFTMAAGPSVAVRPSRAPQARRACARACAAR